MTEDQPSAGDLEAPVSPPAADQQEGSNVEKDPSDWVTGEEAMTGAQASYLRTLSEQAGEDFDATLNKADASRRIDELQQKTGRGES